MYSETVSATARPMLYVSRTSSMDSNEIKALMGEAFAKLGAFIGQNGIVPAGPPLAVYRDWNGKTMQVEVGFPIASKDINAAHDGVLVGQTPSGRAIKTIHKGPYETLRDTYRAFEKPMRDAGIDENGTVWEVYINDPETVPPDELLTEIYALLPQ